MIFFNPQLMHSEQELQLYLVSNPSAFERFEDHEAALQIQLHDLVAHAMEEGENLVALIEDYLNIGYTGGSALEDVAYFIEATDKMQFAMHALKEHWDTMDSSLPEESVRFSSTTRKQATAIFSEISLRSYLEALSNVTNG